MNSRTQVFPDLVYQFHQTISPLDVKLIYEGEINHEIMKVFTSLTERELKGEQFKGQKKVFNIMVESLQNISKHSTSSHGPENQEVGNGIFLISNNDTELNIVTGNIIDIEKKAFLEEKLSYINTLDKESLREFYKKTLKEATLSQKGGAGLGFIDIARKTQNKLLFKFHDLDDDRSFFILSSKISK